MPVQVGGGWRDNRVRSRLGLRLLATAAPERAEHAPVVAAVRRKPACVSRHFGTTIARRAVRGGRRTAGPVRMASAVCW